MKYFSLLIVVFLIFTGCKKEFNYRQVSKGINIDLPEGTLGIYPVSDNAVRIKLFKEEEPEIPEFIFTSGTATPDFQTVETSSELTIKPILVAHGMRG
mgnify:CR=1 FL=1